MRFFISTLCIVLLISGCSDGGPDAIAFFSFTKLTETKLEPSDLVKWELVGKGEVSVDEEENALVLTEGAGSKGITLVSPESYGRHVVLSFDVIPMSFEGINFVFLSASDRVTMGKLKVADDHRGNTNFWTEGRVQNYIFAYHNGFTEAKPFIKKNPGLKNIAISNDLVEGKGVYSVECGRKGRKLWIKVDGKTVVTGKDNSRGGLPGGRIGFRLRGPGSGSYTCLFKNVAVRHE